MLVARDDVGNTCKALHEGFLLRLTAVEKAQDNEEEEEKMEEEEEEEDEGEEDEEDEEETQRLIVHV